MARLERTGERPRTPVPARESDARNAGPRDAAADERLREAEESLLRAELRFHHTVERIADGILVVDVRGTILFTNPAGEQIFGRPAAELVGSDLGVPLVSGETTQIDLVGDGPPRVAELRVADTVWEDGEALLVSVRDITDRRDAEDRARTLIAEQLRRQQAEATGARSRLLAEASRVVSGSLDQHRILAELVRLTAASLGDHCVVELFGGSGYGPFRRLLASHGSDGATEIVLRAAPEAGARKPSALERRVQSERRRARAIALDPEWIDRAASSDEERELWRSLHPASVVVAPVTAGTDPLGLLAVVSSHPERPLDEQDEALIAELAYRAGVALENARLLRMAQAGSRAKSDFLAVISHELRTPLTGIMGYAGLLAEEVERPLLSRERLYVDGIVRSADRLLRVIDQILLFAHSRSEEDEVRYRRLPLSELLDDVGRVVGPLAVEAGLDLAIAGPPHGATITTDAEMVRHILLHLLTNAVKFTERGRVVLAAEVSDGVVRLRVSDSGRGIPQDKLDQIFEPFRQAEDPLTRAVGGTGIGLNVVQNLVRLLGGTMEVSSAVGRGSDFVVSLPQSRHREYETP